MKWSWDKTQGVSLNGTMEEIRTMIESQMDVFLTHPADGPLYQEVGDTWFALKWSGRTLTFTFSERKGPMNYDRPMPGRKLSGVEIQAIVLEVADSKGIRIKD